MPPNRWMHVRHPRGFDTVQFDRFKAQCRIFRAHVEATLANWRILRGHEPPSYEFYEPELSADGKIATLPLGGTQTLGSRHEFEDWRSTFLWELFPLEFVREIEEGMTESLSDTGPSTNWRSPCLRIPAWAAKGKLKT